MDLLIIEKRKNVQIQNEIGRIFRRHNVIEYKSPDDGMTIDDFFKTLGYAYLYKGLGEKVDQIPLEELTISLFRAIVPKQLFNKLAGYGYAIEMQVSGIYYVQGLAIPAQIIVTSELELQNHESLKVLSKSAEKEDIQKFTEMAKNFKEPGDKEKADNVYKGIRPLTGDDIAETVYFAASVPEYMQIAEMLVMPTNQATGTIVSRK